MLIEIKNRWNGNVLFAHTVEGNTLAITLAMALEAQKNGDAYLRDADLRGADLRDADLRDADLRDADLSGADLRGADLRDADLRGADLRDAYLRDADLRGADLSGAPVLPSIHQTVYAAASAPGALNMGSWHCGTTHCRAGWVITLAGEEGKELEEKIGTPAAAMAIYMASDTERWKTERLPNFYCDNDKALADMKRMAEEEAKGKV